MPVIGCPCSTTTRRLRLLKSRDFDPKPQRSEHLRKDWQARAKSEWPTILWRSALPQRRAFNLLPPPCIEPNRYNPSANSSPNRSKAMHLNKWFAQVAEAVSHAAGHALAFIICCVVVLIWAASGPAFGFSAYLAVGHQHRNNNRHVPDGVPDSEHPKP